MLNDSTLLASIAFLIADTLEEEEKIDAAPMLAACEIDSALRRKPGARVSGEQMGRMWDEAIEACGDTTLGIRVGRRAKPAAFFVLGYAWHASATLKDALERAVRYESIFDTGERKLRLDKIDDTYRLRSTYREGATPIRQAQLDAMIAGLLMLCESAAGRRILPLKVELMIESSPHPEAYEALFEAPVEYGADEYAMVFSAADLEAPLEQAIPDIVEATDDIADRYVASLEKSSVATQVRQLLLQMLPSGSAEQESVATRLYRSSSTLQRQLSAEGTSYRDVLEGTRRSLAQRYLRGGEHSHAQIAYLLGFSYQSNFARAFRRWTGMSPRQYQKDPDS